MPGRRIPQEGTQETGPGKDGNGLKKKRGHIYRNLMLTLFGAVALSVVFFFIFYRFESVVSIYQKFVRILMPIIYGAVIAYVLKSICNYFDRKCAKLFRKLKHGSSIANACGVGISLVIGLAIVTILICLVVPSLVESINNLINSLPTYINNIIVWIEERAGNNEVISNYVEGISDTLSDSFNSWINETILPNLNVLIGSVSSGVISAIVVIKNIVIGIIVSAYLLAMRKWLAAQTPKVPYAIFPKKWADLFVEECRYMDQMFTGFINGKLIDSLIMGAICFVGVKVMRMPYAVLLAVIIGVTNIIPFFGPIIGAIPCFFLVLVVSPKKSIFFLIFILILQQFDGNILGPKILGNSTGLSSFWVLFSIIVFGGLFGFVGMVIGVPVFAVIYDVLRRLINKGLAYRKQKYEEEQAAKAAEAEGKKARVSIQVDVPDHAAVGVPEDAPVKAPEEAQVDIPADAATGVDDTDETGPG